MRPTLAGRRPADSTAALLIGALHLRQGLLTATGLALGAALSGRALHEVGLVFATVLVGQAVLGWHRALVDGLQDPGTMQFALCCALLLVVPLSISNGVTAGCAYLTSLAIGMLGNLALRDGVLSWVPWAAAWALYPAFLSYGGWGGAATGRPPTVAMVVLAAALGVVVHVLCSLPGLVAEHERGSRSLPLRLALKVGAPRLLTLSRVAAAVLVVALLVAGASVGLRQ